MNQQTGSSEGLKRARKTETLEVSRVPGAVVDEAVRAGLSVEGTVRPGPERGAVFAPPRTESRAQPGESRWKGPVASGACVFGEAKGGLCAWCAGGGEGRAGDGGPLVGLGGHELPSPEERLPHRAPL